MLFNSFEFLLFLPVVFLIYWFVAVRNLTVQNIFIVLASYVFYGWWNPMFLLLIFITSVCSYASGVGIDVAQRRGRTGRWIAVANVLLNLGILGVYKYYDFFVSGLVELFAGMGIQLSGRSLGLILPVGISFYTFQALSYTIDVYRGKLCATRDLPAFLAFISFFPQLVAGPIERATNLLPQFLHRRHFDYEAATDGMRQILWGLFKKMVVADNCAVAVNHIFGHYETMDGPQLLMGAVFFTFQIYGDFSGYSDIAIGTARLFGIRLMRNFAFPYFSRDIAEFWRRWHISLTTWFRDYIYIPLGGSRCGRLLTMRNTLVIFLVSGLWHGANWTFIVWGAFHALLFLPLMLLGRNRRHKDGVAEGRMLPSWREVLSMAVTFACVVTGWIIFRADSVGMAVGYIVRMVTEFRFAFPAHGTAPFIYIAVLLVAEWVQRDKQHALQIDRCSMFRHRPVRWLLYYGVFLATFLLAGEQEDFIYFQF